MRSPTSSSVHINDLAQRFLLTTCFTIKNPWENILNNVILQIISFLKLVYYNWSLIHKKNDLDYSVPDAPAPPNLTKTAQQELHC